MIGDGGLVLLWWEFGQDCRFCGAWLWRWRWAMGGCGSLRCLGLGVGVVSWKCVEFGKWFVCLVFTFFVIDGYSLVLLELNIGVFVDGSCRFIAHIFKSSITSLRCDTFGPGQA